MKHFAALVMTLAVTGGCALHDVKRTVRVLQRFLRHTLRRAKRTFSDALVEGAWLAGLRVLRR